jgi:hypothetical protein
VLHLLQSVVFVVLEVVLEVVLILVEAMLRLDVVAVRLRLMLLVVMGMVALMMTARLLSLGLHTHAAGHQLASYLISPRTPDDISINQESKTNALTWWNGL